MRGINNVLDVDKPLIHTFHLFSKAVKVPENAFEISMNILIRPESAGGSITESAGAVFLEGVGVGGTNGDVPATIGSEAGGGTSAGVGT